MSYRKIVVANRAFKWRVGRKNIEIRHDDDGNPFKLVLPKPNKRWGVISPRIGIAGPLDLKIDIFHDELNAHKQFKVKKCFLSEHEDQVELVSLPDKSRSVTPKWIQDQIEDRLNLRWKLR